MICASRIVSIYPQCIDSVIDKILPLINQNTKRMIMPTLILALEICKTDPSKIERFREWSTRLANIQKIMLKQISRNYQINDVNHPMMQIKILKLMAFIGADDKEVINFFGLDRFYLILIKKVLVIFILIFNICKLSAKNIRFCQ